MRATRFINGTRDASDGITEGGRAKAIRRSCKGEFQLGGDGKQALVFSPPPPSPLPRPLRGQSSRERQSQICWGQAAPFFPPFLPAQFASGSNGKIMDRGGKVARLNLTESRNVERAVPKAFTRPRIMGMLRIDISMRASSA
jgi:hypothetical protein